MRVPALLVFGVHEEDLPLSRAARDRIWREFLRGGTTHSAGAHTLPFIMRRCEREGIPFTLIASPGLGYRIEPGPRP